MTRRISKIGKDSNPSLRQNMRQRSTKGKMLEILTKLTNHPFAVPFPKNEQIAHNSRRTLCEIMAQMENNTYTQCKRSFSFFHSFKLMTLYLFLSKK